MACRSTARRRGDVSLGARRRGRRLGGRVALSTSGGLGCYWAAQWHLTRAAGKRFQGCRAKRLYVNYSCPPSQSSLDTPICQHIAAPAPCSSVACAWAGCSPLEVPPPLDRALLPQHSRDVGRVTPREHGAALQPVVLVGRLTDPRARRPTPAVRSALTPLDSEVLDSCRITLELL